MLPGPDDADYDDEYEDEYDDLDYVDEDDEYYEDDEYDDDLDYDDEFEDEYDDDEDRDDEVPGTHLRRRGLRRLTGRREPRDPSRPRRGRLLRREEAPEDFSPEGAAAAPAPRPRPRPTPVDLVRPSAHPDETAAEHDAPRRRRPSLPRVSVPRPSLPLEEFGELFRNGAARTRRWATAGITGTRSAASWARHHWGRAAYIYLAIVGIGLLVTMLFYAKSGFTYDECGLCGVPVLTTVSPWWLLLVPLNIANWPLFGPILVLLVMAVVNAELVDRWSKRPQPIYPDWD